MESADIYIRVSTLRQARGHGLVRQLEVCEEWIKDNGIARRSIIQDICSEWKSEHLQSKHRPLPAGLHTVKEVWFATEPLISWKGNLGRAISAWKSGRISPPSLLVFEEWDRLDRGWEIEGILEQFDGMELVCVGADYLLPDWHMKACGAKMAPVPLPRN
jgi:hypothetical protein